jgi:hypothetical protein
MNLIAHSGPAAKAAQQWAAFFFPSVFTRLSAEKGP